MADFTKKDDTTLEKVEIVAVRPEETKTTTTIVTKKQLEEAIVEMQRLLELLK